jgi:release factor glutamine methyltransferase
MWLVDQLASVQEQLTILDIGTGSGCIALYLAKKLPRSVVYGIDVNPEAIKLAKLNQQKLCIENVTFIEADITGMPQRGGEVESINIPFQQ